MNKFICNVESVGRRRFLSYAVCLAHRDESKRYD